MKQNFVQFELWKDCKNGCKFCFNRGQAVIQKEKSLNFVIDKLNSNEIYDYDGIGFIGGEFFDGQIKNSTIKSKFYKLFDMSVLYLKEQVITKVYFTTSLIFDIKEYLIPFLDYLQETGQLDKFILCTSYDLKYRFKNTDDEELWKNNVIFLRNKYQNLKIHVETILSAFFIESVLNRAFNIKAFKELYCDGLDFLEPESGLFYYDKRQCAKDIPDFFPTKEQFIKFINQECLENKNLDINTLLSQDFRANRLYFHYDGELICFDDRIKSEKATDCSKLRVKYEIGLSDSENSMLDIVEIFRQGDRS